MIVMNTFAWHRSDEDTYSQAASGASNTDYYSLMHKIEAYGGLGVWGLAALTQLLATFGIMVGINMMVWGLVVPFGAGLIELAVAVLGFMAYNQFWDQYQASNATAEAYMATMEREMAQHTASHVAGAFELYHYMSSWVWAAYEAASEEEKAKFREDKEFLAMLRLTPEMVKDWGMDGKKEKMDGEYDDMMDKEMKPEDKPSSLLGPIPSLRKVIGF